MKYLVTTSTVNILGNLWMGGKATYNKDLSKYDIENMTDDNGNITRESVDLWLAANAGDFASIIDFRADIETEKGNVLIEWQSEENEMIYNDITYPF